jgi:hypothetical protein
MNSAIRAKAEARVGLKAGVPDMSRPKEKPRHLQTNRKQWPKMGGKALAIGNRLGSPT